jgi:hypothetical protein
MLGQPRAVLDDLGHGGAAEGRSFSSWLRAATNSA